MDRSQEHKDYGDYVYGIGIKGSDRQVLGAESSCSRHAEGMVYGVESRHSGQPVADECRYGNSQIYCGKYPYGLVRTCPVTFFGERRHLHIGQPEPHRTGGRDNQQKEHHDSQASDEMRGRAPEQQAVRQLFHICQYGGSSSGIT